MKKIVLLVLVLVVGLMTACSSEEVKESSIDLANKYMLDGKYTEAIIEFKKAIEIQPKNYDLYEGLVNAYIKIDNDESKQGIIDTAKKYYGVDPADTRLFDFICLNIGGLDLKMAYAILSELYDMSGYDEIMKKMSEIEEKIYSESGYMSAYGEIINEYGQAYDMLSQGNNTSDVISNCPRVNTEYLMNWSRDTAPCYTLRDFDNDDIPELIIGINDPWEDYTGNVEQTIYGMYRYSGGEAVSVATWNGYRSEGFVLSNNNFYIMSDGGMFNGSHTMNEYNNGEFIVVDRVELGDGVWSHNKLNCSEEDARNFINEYKEEEIELSLIPVSEYEAERHNIIKEVLMGDNS